MECLDTDARGILPLDNLTKPGSTAVMPENKSDQNPRSNPVCLEIGVTIRSLPGEKDEASSGSAKPTREEARTVIVFDNGAVLRLTSNFPPGQAVILSNSQGRDVVCRVVSTKNLPNVKGYIEVEFLEPTTDFWGIHKPEGQSLSSNPPAPAVVTQTKPLVQPQVAPPQIVPTAPPPAPPASARVAPALSEPVVSIGKGPTFEDIADAVPMSPPPIVRPKQPESTPRIPASRTPDDSTHATLQAARSYSPTSTSGPADELTSLSRSWEGTQPPAHMPSSSQDILGKFSSSSATPSESRGKTPLIVGGAAVILLGLGAGIFFMRGGSSVTPSPAPVAAVSKPALSDPPASANVPTPALVDQPVEAQATQAASLPPTIPATSSVPKETVATATPSAQQAPRRQTSNVLSKQPNQVDVQPTEAVPPRPQVVRSLKMSAPTIEGQSGTMVDASVPTMEDATVSGAAGVPGGGLISTSSHPARPPAPPVAFPTASSSGKAATEPKLMSSTRPAYPALAKQSSTEGDVVVAADIDANGKVVGAKAISGPMYLRQAAVDAVGNWKYEPATLNGRPTSAQVSVKIQFRLK